MFSFEPLFPEELARQTGGKQIGLTPSEVRWCTIEASIAQATGESTYIDAFNQCIARESRD